MMEPWYCTRHCRYAINPGRPDRTIYSMSAQIPLVRSRYYDILAQIQQGMLDITEWLNWFLRCYEHALSNTARTPGKVLSEAKFGENPQLLFDGKPTSSKWAKIANALRTPQCGIYKILLSGD